MVITPKVPSEQWEGARALALFRMGTTEVDPDQLAFEDVLERFVLREDAEAETWSELEERAIENDVTHPHFARGMRVTADTEGRSRPHRPQLSEEIVEDVREQVRKEYPDVPVGSLSFSDVLGLLLKRVEAFYAKLGCRVEEKPSE